MLLLSRLTGETPVGERSWQANCHSGRQLCLDNGGALRRLWPILAAVAAWQKRSLYSTGLLNFVIFFLPFGLFLSSAYINKNLIFLVFLSAVARVFYLMSLEHNFLQA
jgi:hypothetical protein